MLKLIIVFKDIKKYDKYHIITINYCLNFVVGKMSKFMDTTNCFHCGNEVIKKDEILFDEKKFCCNGCKTVYEIFTSNDMSCYYDFQASPGATPLDIKGKYDFLDDEKIVTKLLEFEENSTHIVSLYIPHIHCSSCIWILENLQKLQPGISTSQVNFPEKKVRINYNPETTNLKQIVERLCVNWLRTLHQFRKL